MVDFGNKNEEGSGSDIKVLESKARSSDIYHSLPAIGALGKLNDIRALESLVRACHCHVGSSDWRIASAIFYALENIGKFELKGPVDRSVEELLRTLLFVYSNDPTSSIAKQLARLIGQICSSEESIGTLTAALGFEETTATVRVECIRALERIAGRTGSLPDRATEAIKKAKDDGVAHVREEAALALDRLKDKLAPETNSAAREVVQQARKAGDAKNGNRGNCTGQKPNRPAGLLT